MPHKECKKKKLNPLKVGTCKGGDILKPCCFPKDEKLQVSDPLGQSSKMGEMGFAMTRVPLKVGDPMNMRRAVMANLVEERRNQLYIEKLRKDLEKRLREIERQKADMEYFLYHLHRTTGYFTRLWFD